MQHRFPPYPSCEACGEYERLLLRVKENKVFCLNCADSSRPLRQCCLCGKVAPSEMHHPGLAAIYSDWVLPVCLNCHKELTSGTVGQGRLRIGLGDGSDITDVTDGIPYECWKDHPEIWPFVLSFGMLDMILLHLFRWPDDPCRAYIGSQQVFAASKHINSI